MACSSVSRERACFGGAPLTRYTVKRCQKPDQKEFIKVCPLHNPPICSSTYLESCRSPKQSVSVVS